MAEGELHRRTVSSTPRITPEEVANRGFASAFRGISETEVRNFLRRVADDLAASRERERELTARIDDLETRLRNPPPLTEQQLLDALGEETARVLRSAQEAAEDIRSRTEERAALAMREAQEEARRLREAAEEESARNTREAEAASLERSRDAEAIAAELLASAEREAGEIRERAARDAAGELDGARTAGREMVGEARAVRERVLTDLTKRRALLQAQLDELRTGRDRLLDAYRVVRRTFVEATDALGNVEAPAAEGAVAAVPEAPAETGAETPSVTAEAEEPDLSEPPGGANVDELFARLRAGRVEAVERARDVLAEGTAASAVESPGRVDLAAGEPEAATPGDAAGADGMAETSSDVSRGEASTASADEPTGPDAPLIRSRDEAVEPALDALVRTAKRALQDEQNELLDVVRKQKRRPAASKVLSTEEVHHKAWADVLRPSVDDVYVAGFVSVGSRAPSDTAPAAAPGELVTELGREFISGLHDRLVASIGEGATPATGGDSADAADSAGGADLDDGDLTQRIGARYREFKGQRLEAVAGDALATAYARGIYDAAPEGTLLRWIPSRAGRCSDCDDNALEPTVRGETFPTGQPAPPAHPGCRCLLAVAEPAPRTGKRSRVTSRSA